MYKLIVGLGNKGEKYQSTRHNFGFMAIDAIAGTLGFPNCINKFHSEFTQLDISTQKVILLKPQTYMNHSGIAVRECMNFYKVPVQNILVIHDELDIDLGKIKIKAGGSSGGHNGLKSIDENIGDNYYRLRLGITKPEYKAQVSDYVLHNFNDREMKIVDFILQFIVNNFTSLLKNEYEKFLNNYAIEYKKEYGVK